MLKAILRIIFVMITILGSLSIYLYLDEINIFEGEDKKQQEVIVNEYYRSQIDNYFVNLTDDFAPSNRQELLNIFYTIINSGMDKYTFYCDSKYKECLADVKGMMNDNTLLGHINNFVPTYNIYSKIRITYTERGKVTLNVSKLYSEDKIALINTKIDTIYNEVVFNTSSTTENIKKIHDYIINHAKYDVSQNEENTTSKYQSNTAYGPLFEGYAICSGYTQLMSLFLDKMGVVNHRVSSSNHVWNLVYIDGKWLHLDLTWDDPVTDNGKDILQYDYFLVETGKLKELDIKDYRQEHIYNEAVYKH